MRPGYIIRLSVCVALLSATAFLTYRLDIAMHANRQRKIDLAEISHIRYGLLNANVWADRLAPIFSKKIAAFDLTSGDKDALRPSIEKMVNRMIVQSGEIMGEQIGKDKALGVFAGPIKQFLTNTLLKAENLRGYVPKLTDTILSELGKPEAKQAIQQSVKRVFLESAATTSAEIDMTQYSTTLKKYGCTAGDECQGLLLRTINEEESRIGRNAAVILAMVALAFALMLIKRSPILRSETMVLALFCAVLLWAGLRNPMIDIDARIMRLSFQLSGEPIEFTDQVLFFQSKSIIDVVRLLFETRKPGMVTVGLMVLAFSVIFPIAKLAASALYCYRVRGLQESAFVKFFALKSGKWSMADVLVVALFMAYIGFDGVISAQLGQLREAAGMDVLTTNNTILEAGFFLFLGFCIAGLLLGQALERSSKKLAA
jgi:Paraquat-inducible protein A